MTIILVLDIYEKLRCFKLIYKGISDELPILLGVASEAPLVMR